jgi:hypothetical protein
MSNNTSASGSSLRQTQKENRTMPKNVTKMVEVRVGQVWRDLDTRNTVTRYITITRLTGQRNAGFYAARCDPNGHVFSGGERRYSTAAFLRRVGHKSGFALHKDAP